MTPFPIIEPMNEADKEIQSEIILFACSLGNRGFDRKTIARGLRIASEFLTFAESLQDSPMTTALDINDFIYRTGTITISPGDTVATFTGTALNSGPVKDGDELSAGGTSNRIKEIISDTQAELFTPYVGPALTNGQYLITKSSLLRYHSALIAVEIGSFLSRLNEDQIVYEVPGDEPDPSIGKEDDLALKADISPWKLWRMLSGVWVLQDPPAEKGDKGDKGDTGESGLNGVDGTAATLEIGTVTTLPAGSSATAENVGTSSAAILNLGIPKGADGADGTGIGDMVAANNLSDVSNVATARTNLGLDDVVFGPASSTDNAAARFDSTTGKIIQNSPLIIADTTGALSRSGNGGIPVQGTNTNDNASAGYVGEYITAALASVSAISLSSGVVSDVISISLTAGDWDVSGNVLLTASASNLLGTAWVSTASVTTPSLPNISYARYTASAAGVESIPTGVARISLSSTTTVYLSTQPLFSTGTVTGAGVIAARRVR